MSVEFSSDIHENLKNSVKSEVLSILTSNRSACCKTDDGYALSLRFYDLQKPTHKESRIFFILSGKQLKIFAENKRIMSVLPHNRQMDGTDALYETFAGLVRNDINELDNLEKKILSLEDELLNGRKPDKDVLKRIVGYKHRVLKIKRYYNQLAMISETIEENENEMFSEQYVKKFHMISRKIDRLLQDVLHLYECIVQVREVYQAQIDIEQNNVMRIFTVITTIFFPLTLIAGWYGMNLKMPEFSWDLGYLFVIILSVAFVIGSIIVFKIKKWF